MKRVIAITLLAALTMSCVSVDGRVIRVTATPGARPPDFTVPAKSGYNGGESGKTGKYVTIMLFGARTETAVSDDCYDRTVVGSVLSPDCR